MNHARHALRPLLPAMLLVGAMLSPASAGAPASRDPSDPRLEQLIRLLAKRNIDGFSEAQIREQQLDGLVRAIDRDGWFNAHAPLTLRKAKGGQAPVSLAFRHGRVEVDAPIPGHPTAGELIEGDRVVSVDGNPRARGSLALARELLAGEPGTTVAIVIERGASEAPIERTVLRVAWHADDVDVERPRADVLLVRPHFQSHAADGLASHLNEEWRRAPYRGLIVDLRGQHGGLFDAALRLAGLFVPPDTAIAQVVAAAANGDYRVGDPLRVFETAGLPSPAPGLELRTLPVVVIVDLATSAGAELLAVALKDIRHAPIIGRTTDGRASIQTLFMAPGDDDAQVALTTMRWGRLNGVRLDRVGITPDVVTPPDRGGDVPAALTALDAMQRKP